MAKTVIQNTDSPKDSRVPINNMFTELYEMTNVHDATSKTTPVDADELGLWDSVASTIKKLTWANIKATLLIWLRLGTTVIPVNAPRGFLINGKITVTDSGSGLVVAVKGLDGNDPSATNPVYCRIGDTVRSITSALSRTLADGTNWFNAGSTELRTKEIDYFTYLVYDSNSSSVGLGFARVPYGNLVSDFSATTTAETHLAGYADFTTTDEVEVIGRFAAILSAPAGYTWSVPTFTAINLIQKPIYETRWLYWLPTWGGFSANPTNVLHKYKINSRTIHLIVREGAPGTSNGTSFTESAPFTPITETNQVFVSFGTGQNNSTNCGATLSVSSGIPTINVGFGTNNVTAGWTASGGKRITGQLFYEI